MLNIQERFVVHPCQQGQRSVWNCHLLPHPTELRSADRSCFSLLTWRCLCQSRGLYHVITWKRNGYTLLDEEGLTIFILRCWFMYLVWQDKCCSLPFRWMFVSSHFVTLLDTYCSVNECFLFGWKTKDTAQVLHRVNCYGCYCHVVEGLIETRACMVSAYQCKCKLHPARSGSCQMLC